MSPACSNLQTASPEGSILFSYVQTDDFCEKYETSRSITTSKWEGQNHLANKLLTDPRNRQKVHWKPLAIGKVAAMPSMPATQHRWQQQQQRSLIGSTVHAFHVQFGTSMQ